MDDCIINLHSVSSTNSYATIVKAVREQNEIESMMTFLREVQLDNKTPSHLLHLMKISIGERIIDEAILKHMWFNKLPTSVKLPLSIRLHENLDDLAIKADTVMEIHKTSVTVSKKEAKTLEGLCCKVDNLKERIRKLESMQEPFNCRRSSSAHHSQPRRASPQSPIHCLTESDLCWYHRKFGENARNCGRICSWKTMNEKSHNSRKRHHTPPPFRLSERSRSGERGLCWYHQRFGKKAINCWKPCSWVREQTTNHRRSRCSRRQTRQRNQTRSSSRSKSRERLYWHRKQFGKEAANCCTRESSPTSMHRRSRSLKRNSWRSPRHATRSNLSKEESFDITRSMRMKEFENRYRASTINRH